MHERSYFSEATQNKNEQASGRVSIIINTDGRAKSLAKTLESLRHLDFPDFEVCVVYGPTSDGTKELVEEWADRIRAAHCPTRNLSQSRNIGLAMAAGDIVAFLDDDSIPEPEWLSKILRPFANPVVAAAGGFLLNHTGVAYQWRFGTADRMGRADTSWERPAPEFNFPLSASFPHVMANSAFRLSAVMAVGGFDEQYTYFLDETDLICRLVDAGYSIIQLDGTPVHHKYAASHLRSENRVLTARHAVIRSKIYFSLMNSHGHHTVSDAISDAQRFAEELRGNLEWAINEGLASSGLREQFKTDVDDAFRDGLMAGLAGKRRLFDHTAHRATERKFLAFPILRPPIRRHTICLLSQTYPPASIGGVGRYIHQLARSMAALGHQVHVLTRAKEHDTVDFEDGVWVHRFVPKNHARGREDVSLAVPEHIWNYSATARDELHRIARERDIDVVYAPIWDCEGIAIVMEGKYNVVTSLQTTLKFWLDSHSHMQNDRTFMETFAAPMLACERFMLVNSTGVHAISAAIAAEIALAYNIDFSSIPMAIVPLGQEDWSVGEPPPAAAMASDTVRLLFVGRLEERKGIDILLDILPDLLRAHPALNVDIVGNDTLRGEHGETYSQRFKRIHAGTPLLSRVRFHGEVPEEALRSFYRDCDIFVAPSRFESFGLILLEAMMFGKPVVACRAGGMVEVVAEGVTGLLANPGDTDSLRTAIDQLVSDRLLRQRMGNAGRQRYLDHFTPERMAKGVFAFLSEIALRPRHVARSPH